MTDEERFLQPTYNSVLISALIDIVQALNNPTIDIEQIWRCIDTLLDIAPDCVETDVGAFYKAVIQRITHDANTVGVDSYHSRNLSVNKTRELKRLYARQLIRKIRKSLKEGGYLEMESHRPRTKETGLKSLEEKMKFAHNA